MNDKIDTYVLFHLDFPWVEDKIFANSIKKLYNENLKYNFKWVRISLLISVLYALMNG